MAEFFSDCIREIRIRLGFTDAELANQLYFLSEETKKAIINDGFEENPVFVIENYLPKPLKDFFEFVDYYYEPTSMEKIDLYEEQYQQIWGMSHEALDYLSLKCNKLRSISIWLKEDTDFGDKSIELLVERCQKLQVVNLYGNCANLTDASLLALGKLPELRRLNMNILPNMTNAGLASLTKNCTKLEALTFSGDINFSDEGIANMPTSISYFTSESSGYTSDGVATMVQRAKNLLALELAFAAKLDDRAVIEILKNCQNISEIDMTGSTLLTDACLNTVPIPASLKRLAVSKGTKITVPSGSACEISYLEESDPNIIQNVEQEETEE